MITKASIEAFLRKKFRADPKLTVTFKPTVLADDTGLVNALSAFENGTTVVSGSSDKFVKIWDITSGLCLQTLGKHKSAVTAVLALPSNIVVSGDKDGTLKLWSVTSGSCLKTWDGHTRTIKDLKALTDGTFVSGGFSGADEIITHWNVEAKCLRAINTGQGVTTITVLQDDSVVSGHFDGTLRRWNVKSGECIQVYSDDNRGCVRSLVALANGTMLSLDSNYNRLICWDVASGNRWKFSPKNKSKPYIQRITALTDDSVVFSYLYSYRNYSSGAFECWDTTKPEHIQTLGMPGRWTIDSPIIVLPDGSAMVRHNRSMATYLPDNIKILWQRVFNEVQLERAIEQGVVAKMQALLKPGLFSLRTAVDINYINTDGYSPLMLATTLQESLAPSVVATLLPYCQNFLATCQDVQSPHYKRNALQITCALGHYAVATQISMHPTYKQQYHHQYSVLEQQRRANELNKLLDDEKQMADIGTASMRQAENEEKFCKHNLTANIRELHKIKAVLVKLNLSPETDEKRDASVKTNSQMQEQLQKLQLQHDELWLQHQYAKRKKRTISIIKDKPGLCCYYQTILLKLEAFFVAYKVAGTGVVELTTTGGLSLLSTSVAAGVSVAAKQAMPTILEFLGQSFAFIPGAALAGALGKASGAAITALEKKRQKNRALKISQLDSLSRLMVLAEETACQLTLMYAPLLHKIPINEKTTQHQQSADNKEENNLDVATTRFESRQQNMHKKLADYAVLHIISSLIQSPPSTSLTAEKLTDRLKLKSETSRWFFNKIRAKIGLMNIFTTDGRIWEIPGVYENTGIKTNENEYFTNDNFEANYGYHLGTAEQAKRLDMRQIFFQDCNVLAHEHEASNKTNDMKVHPHVVFSSESANISSSQTVTVEQLSRENKELRVLVEKMERASSEAQKDRERTKQKHETTMMDIIRKMEVLDNEMRKNRGGVIALTDFSAARNQMARRKSVPHSLRQHLEDFSPNLDISSQFRN